MPNWYKDAIIYELHVRAFFDGNGDGIGDFEGLIAKLDYLSDLGVTAIWLLPFYPSPLKDDGYDIANYYDIHPAYGALPEFKVFLHKAHQRGIKVITELVINHTSDQHEWFRKSRRAKAGDYWRDFYVWSDDPNRYQQARIIFKDYETSNWAYDPVAKSYYWHRFYSHQPDLNFDNPEVKKAIFKVVDFWFSMGVDGMRLDAIPYLYERENTSCENLPETHAFLRELRRHIDDKYPNRLLIAEANQWPEDAVAYFGEGDECQMCFHFPLMPRLFMALKTEDRFAIIDILNQTPPIPDNCQWGMFLRNHDELTLEMVTDEERDYMYRVYTADPRARINLGIRHRLAPLLRNDRRQIELLFSILFSLTGTPIIYYGDEIAMGDNIYLGDRNGVRTPLQWSADRNAGFSRADPQSLYLPINISPEYHYEAINVENQQNNHNSLLWSIKNLVALRKTNLALSRGTLDILSPDNTRVLVFVRQYQEQAILIIANLSRKVQCVELDLSAFERRIPVEMTSRVDFPAIASAPYFFTLGPYSNYWFELVAREETSGQPKREIMPTPVRIKSKPVPSLEDRSTQSQIEMALQSYLPTMRWFIDKHKNIKSCSILDVVLMPHLDREQISAILLVKANYYDGEPDHYVVPISAAEGENAARIKQEKPQFIIAHYLLENEERSEGVYYDGAIDGGFAKAIADLTLSRHRLNTKWGFLSATIINQPDKDWAQNLAEPTIQSGEQSNSSFFFANHFYFKLFRKLEPGQNPEAELGQVLTAHQFPNSPSLIAELSYSYKRESHTLGLIQSFIPSESNAWALMLNHVTRFCDEALAKEQQGIKPEIPKQQHFGLLKESVPPTIRELSAYTLELAKLLGQRTAEMHTALSADEEDAAFIPEACTPFYQRSLYQSMRNTLEQSFNLLKIKKSSLSKNEQRIADIVLQNRAKFEAQFSPIRTLSIAAKRIRHHGDYHLGQVLFSGKDFYIIDFEGEPARSFGERKLKRLALRDIASMLRSFDYVGQFFAKEKLVRLEDKPKLDPWLKSWTRWIGGEFVKGYFEQAKNSVFCPPETQAQALTDVFILEKALSELHYELAARPDWVVIPLTALAERIE